MVCHVSNSLSRISNSLKKMSETRMLHRNIQLSTIPPSPSQQHSLSCSNITTSAAAQCAGHQVLSKDRICNWTLHSKDQQLERSCWSPSPPTKAQRRRGTSHVFRECSTCVMTQHIGEQSPRLAALQLDAQHLALYKALCVQLCIPKRWSDIGVGIWGENS